MTSKNPDTTERVMLAHGGGGELMNRLIQECLLPSLNNEQLAPLADSAIVPWPGGDVVFTTDSFVVTPLEFPGGDIGVLSVAGTVNDLAVMGALPLALSLGLIIEEGLPTEILKRIIASIARTAQQAGVRVVTGDTKVIERRGEGGLFINTAGIGRLRPGVNLGISRIEPGDAVIVNAPLANHGLTIMSVRNGLEFESDLRSDAQPLNHLMARVLDSGAQIRFIRDATRGGIAGVLADICDQRRLGVEIDERQLPISATARHAAEMLGLDPINVANEGVAVFVVAGADAERAVAAMRSGPEGLSATVIGRIMESTPPLVELVTRAGGRRIIQRPYGEELPRIC